MATADATKIRPITLRDWEVRAAQALLEFQVRRAVKPQPTGKDLRICEAAYGWLEGEDGKLWGLTAGDHNYEETSLVCPFGRVGDRLAVLETWRPKSWSAEGGWGEIEYKADGQVRRVDGPFTFEQAYPDRVPVNSWRSPAVMPLWASRLDPVIADVRLERLSQISEADAIASGVKRYDFPGFDGPRWSMRDVSDPLQTHRSGRLAYGAQWNRDRGDKSGNWPSPDPWVWRLTLRKVSPVGDSEATAEWERMRP